MQMASSAMRTCIASASAVEWTATLATPISRQARITRRAISPRLAIRILSNMPVPRLFEDDEGGAVFDRCAVLDQNAFHRAAARRRDVVHRLHRLDDKQGIAFVDLLANRNERGRARFRLHVDSTDHR